VTIDLRLGECIEIMRTLPDRIGKLKARKPVIKE